MMNMDERDLLSCDLEELDDRFLNLLDFKKMQCKRVTDDGSDCTGSTPNNPPEYKRGQEVPSQKEDVEGKEEVEDVARALENLDLMDPSLLVALPDLEDIKFNLTCGACIEYSGPPEFSCSLGHVICSDCYHKLENQTCPTQLDDTDNPEDANTYDCGRKVTEIPEIVKTSPYYQHYLKEATFTCGAFGMGCDKMEMKADEIAKHESEECKFRTLRFCQFRAIGCSERFTTFGANLTHLIEAHQIPVSKDGEGHFHVPYDRAGFGESCFEEHFGIIPVIRAVVVVASKLVCVLAVKELEEEKMTRIWVSYFGHLEKGEDLDATLCMASSTENDEVGGQYGVEIHLPVLPAITTISDVESTTCYIDVENDYLDREMSVEHDGERCLNLMLSIVKTSDEAASSEDDDDDDDDEGSEDSTAAEAGEIGDTVEDSNESLSEYI